MDCHARVGSTLGEIGSSTPISTQVGAAGSVGDAHEAGYIFVWMLGNVGLNCKVRKFV